MTATGCPALPVRAAVAMALAALIVVSMTGAASAAVGGALRTITPAAATTVDGTMVDPTCDTQGGTSIAVVQGSKLAGVDPVRHPVLLATTCLDNGGSDSATQRRSRLSFLDPGVDPVTGLPSGKVVKAIQTTMSGVVAAPDNGWAHLVHRPDFGDLLGCGNDGAIYAIDFSQYTAVADGTATPLPRPAGLAGNCVALGWDAEEDMIYQGLGGGTAPVGVYRFRHGTTELLGSFSTPCTPSGVAMTGGVLVVACQGLSTVLRLDKSTGAILAVNGTLGVLGLPPGTDLDPDLGDLACDPVTFQKGPAGKDQFKDAMWSRNGPYGNGVVALEFPAFTCGLPPTATVLRAGLSAPGPGGPGEIPAAACVDAMGNVVDADDDGLPDCWETGGIDFDGDGVVDLQLCVQVDTNGDGVPDATECAHPGHKDLFVEIDYMQDHKPDPQALSQTQSVAAVGVKSVREAFGAAPVGNPDATTGIRIHFQVDEQVTVPTLAGTSASHVDELVFTPCTPPAVNPNGTLNAKSLADAADFDAIKKANFGTAAQRASAGTLNAKRLAFRYMLFAHKQVGLNQGGATNSGCSELGGDDSAITLGAFATTSLGGVSHPRGTTDQQAGTVMHEFGHNLLLRHGGGDNVNCKPNFPSVMSYSRQFAGSPIPGRRLDYSRAEHPVLADINKTGVLDEAHLNEFVGLGTDPSLGPIPPFFPSAEQIAFGPSAWSVVMPGSGAINWNRSKQGPNPTYQNSVSGDLNQGVGGCEGSGTLLAGHDDWSNVLYRASAALDFAGGVHGATSAEHVSITTEQEEELFLAGDLDSNGVADAQDCGAFACTHRIDIKPSFSLPKSINLGLEATVTVVIFSELGGSRKWDAPAQVQKDVTLTFSVESVVKPVKINSKGQGTCSAYEAADPGTGVKDGAKDLFCQFPTGGLPSGTNFGVVSGFFLDPATGELRAFRARQLVTILP